MALGSVGWAQETPRAELGFDYSFARYSPSASYTQGHSLNGGGGVFAVNFGRHLGLAMDLQSYNADTVSFVIPPNRQFTGGGTGAVSGNLFTYLFGPVVKFRTQYAQPYFDLLFGGAHSSVYANAFKTICQPAAGGCGALGTPGGNAFAMSLGGGADIPMNHRMAIKVGEFDWLYTRFNNQFTNSGQNNFRYVTGVNVNLGTFSPQP
jgi:hypothetical protein